MKLAHIAFYKRSEGHSGGVPLFGHYLERCLGAKLWSWSDIPVRARCDEPAAAHNLGHWLMESGALAGVDAVVVDGFWGRGLDGFTRPVISVAHGTWRGIGRACGSEPALRLGDVQAVEYARLPTVAVSGYCAAELRDLYGVEPAAVIRNGVPTDEFRPWPHAAHRRPVAIYASNAQPKGGDLILALQRSRSDVEFRVIGAGIGAEAEAIAAGDIYLSPSRTDGCAYAGLQALACGLPVVASPVGLFADLDGEGRLDGYRVGEAVAEVGATPQAVASWNLAISRVLAERNEMGAAARDWALQYGSLERWAREWTEFLIGIAEG